MIDRKTRKLAQKMLAQLEKEYLITSEYLIKLESYRATLKGRMEFVKGMLND